ncbi:MAG: alpha/beta hydrolase [Bacteroidota bacterium]
MSRACIFSLTCFALWMFPLCAKHRLYLLPGHGSDHRVFSKLNLEKFDTVHIRYPVPFPDESMRDYALRISWQIDASRPFSILGVSLGGMLAAELNDMLRPFRVILVSSASCRQELPRRYTFMDKVPFDRIPTGNFYKMSARYAQKLVEPDRNGEGALFDSMLNAKQALFLKRASRMIIAWERSKPKSPNLVHIHGSSDNTLPIKNIKADHVINGGSHMMILTEAGKISDLLHNILCCTDV